MSTSAAGQSDDRCIVLARAIHRAHDTLVAHAESFARSNGLEVGHLSMLHALGLRGEMRMGDLAESVVVGAATVTRRAKQLEERELVRRRRSEESQREVLISLTKEGEALFERSFAHLHAAHRQYFDERFTHQEQRALERLLERV